jgi:hypothetical protein
MVIDGFHIHHHGRQLAIRSEIHPHGLTIGEYSPRMDAEMIKKGA